MMPSDRAWIVLGAGVVVYDLAAPPGQTLSEGADGYMRHHPWLVRMVAFTLAGHVCNLWPERLDAIHWLFVAVRRLRKH